jgi:hypothetical protein
MPQFASETTVSSDRSQQEIQRTLQRYGATQFAYGWNQSGAQVEFVIGNRQVRFYLPLPDPNAKEFTHTPGKGFRRTPEKQREAYEQAIRQRWRALNLVIKAKLEAVEANITSFDEEFLAHIVLPNGMTMGRRIVPEMAQILDGAEMPQLMPSPSSGK